MHAHMHTHTHTRTHAHARTHARTRTHAHTHTHTLLNGGGVDPIKLLGLPKIQLYVGHVIQCDTWSKLGVLLQSYIPWLVRNTSGFVWDTW